MIGLEDPVGKSGRAFGPGMGLHHRPALTTDNLQEFGGISGAIHRAVRGVGGLERPAWRPVHEPVNGFWECDGPVTAEVYVGLLARNEEKVGIRLRAER